MKIGTKSVLYGAHCFFIHPWFVALGWWKLYGFPLSPWLWVCFFVHDLGYWGKPNMDGKEGEEHPRWAADLMWDLTYDMKWYWMCLHHSRYLAKSQNLPPSKLCYADKMAFVITPGWLYKLSVWLTGEWREYSSAHVHEVRPDYAGTGHTKLTDWHRDSVEYVRRWVAEHKDGREDTWTRSKPIAQNSGLAALNSTYSLPKSQSKEPSPWDAGSTSGR